MYERILVATDGSASANRAVSRALEQAEANGATLHAIFVVDTGRYGEPALSSTELVVDSIEDWGRNQLEEVVERADGLGIEVVTRCCHGTPHEEIIGYADDVDADVVVLGYQGQSHAAAERIGSVTDRVVRNAGRPVLVV
ncbi:universal stress protein [Haloplanus halophilus]|uniref:universal stress protein n=1 Tax=Haloplanus halophilus TaxID=2949993 RepID=UPI002040C900|nr:universal stress protein [Haloplanus sp. GDY1]